MQNISILVLVLILSTIGHIATDIYLPSMPHIATYFDTPDTFVKMTLSAYLLSFCVIPIFIGAISDTVGRKRPILIGIYISLFATGLCILSNNIYLLIFSRFLQGIGMGMIVSVSRALLPDHFQGERLTKYLSYMSMLVPLLLAIAPPLGGIIQDNSSWHMVFVTVLIYLLCILVLIKFMMPEKQTRSRSKIKVHVLLDSYKSLLRNKDFMIYTFCTVFTFMGIVAYITVSPFIFQNLIGLSATENGLTTFAMCGLTFFAGFINSRLVNTIAPKTLLYCSSLLIFLSGILLIIINGNDWIRFYPFLLIVFFFFATIPMSFSNAGSLAFKAVQGNFGAATALGSCLQFAGGAISSIIVSLFDNSVVALGLTFLFLGIAYFLNLSFLEKASLATEKY